MVSQKPLTPKPSKSPLQGWTEDGEGKRQPADSELISTHKDTSLHAEDQVDGLNAQTGSEKNVTENKEDTKDDLEKSEIKEENDTKVDGEVIDNGKTEQSGENVNGVKVEGDKRTGNEVFVTQGSEVGEESVQKQENAKQVTVDEAKQSEQLNGAQDKES